MCATEEKDVAEEKTNLASWIQVFTNITEMKASLGYLDWFKIRSWLKSVL